MEVWNRFPALDRFMGYATVRIEEYMCESRVDRTWEIELALRPLGVGHITLVVKYESSLQFL